jgi:hypothetical protein
VSAALGQLRVFHDEDGVGAHDRRQMVRDDDRRRVLHQSVQRFEDGLL